ncbi:TPA: hypothetical protein ACH3X1_015337 [Trebouxia sp. C0004]
MNGAWEDTTVEDAPDHAHLEDILLADTHQADILQTPEEDLKVGARQGTPVGDLAAAPDPFPEADPALPCPPHAEGDHLAQMHHLQGDLSNGIQLNPGWGAPPQQVGRPPKRRAGRSPSPAGSYSSHGSYSSYSSSGSDGSRSPRQKPPAAMAPVGAGAAPGSHPTAGNDYRAELAQAKRREAEASTRVAALEAKLKSSSSGFGEMQATIQELTHRVQKQEETCSHYRKWLSAVAECAKALTDSKAQVVKAEADVKVREEDLAVLVGEAATFVEKERARANKRARRHRDGRPRDAAEALPVSLNGVPDGGVLHQQMISDIPDAGHALPPTAEAATGWAEQGMQIDDQGVVAQDDMVAAKFKPGIKFKLGM